MEKVIYNILAIGPRVVGALRVHRGGPVSGRWRGPGGGRGCRVEPPASGGGAGRPRGAARPRGLARHLAYDPAELRKPQSGARFASPLWRQEFANLAVITNSKVIFGQTKSDRVALFLGAGVIGVNISK